MIGNLHDATVLCPLNASIQGLMHGRRRGSSLCEGFGPGLKSQPSHNVRRLRAPAGGEKKPP